MSITLTEAQTQLTNWLAASTAVANNQEYRIGDRKLVRADATEIRKMIDYWQAQVVQLQRAAAGSSRFGFSVANFNG